MNSLTTPIPSTLLQQKLSQLVIKLQQQASPQGFNQNLPTVESIVTEAFKVLSQFYRTLSDPTFTPEVVYADTPPNADIYNNNFTEILNDLTSLFSEYKNMGGVVVGEFNYLVTRLNRLQAKLKTISSLLGDYSLYANSFVPGIKFFGDTFSNLNKVEVSSSLLNNEQCEINQDEGIATLPIDKNAQVAIVFTKTPIINSNSNGTIGNNIYPSTRTHLNVADIIDGNVDTWFEYDKILVTDDGLPLFLDLTIDIGENKVTNSIRINPYNFGTKTEVEVLALETSTDGKTYLNIADDLGTDGLSLNPTTSKYAGQGFFTFTPRQTRYVHLSLRQSTPYVIQINGQYKYRYAIGIREIEILALPYKEVGEFISANYSSVEEIKKLILNTTEIGDPLLCSIEHFVSPDNGITWNQIRPIVSTGDSGKVETVPELLSFNGPETDTIKTQNIVSSLRYRAVFKRNKEGFSSASTLVTEQLDGTELFSFPTAPYSLQLKNTPINGTLSLVDSSYGRMGDSLTRLPIAFGTQSKLTTHILLDKIPLSYTKNSSSPYTISKDYNLDILVDGAKWTRGPLTGTDKNYLINISSPIEPRIVIEFGDGTNGASPGIGRAISASFPNPELLLPGRDPSHTAILDFYTTGDKERCILLRKDALVTRTATLPKGVKVCNLGTTFVDPESSLTFTDLAVFPTAYKQNFQDGYSEFVGKAANSWSIDSNRGIVYSATPTKSTTDTLLTYSYFPVTQISSADWDFIPSSDGTIKAISISDKVFKIIPVIRENIPSGKRYFNLANLSIAKSTLKFVETTPTAFLKEVNFIDGYNEFLISSPAGVYSVNYLTGEVYTYTTTLSGTTSRYGYTQFYFTYNIARLIPKTDWTYDSKLNQISIASREILRGTNTPSTSLPSGMGTNRNYEAAYKYAGKTRTDIAGLEPFYSSILRDYTLKVLTQSGLL